MKVIKSSNQNAQMPNNKIKNTNHAGRLVLTCSKHLVMMKLSIQNQKYRFVFQHQPLAVTHSYHVCHDALSVFIS